MLTGRPDRTCNGRSGPAAEELILILTADCNLRCRYCYQNAKQPRAMEWPMLQAALDALIALPRQTVTLSFSGGEPTLEWTSIERAVEYVQRHASALPGARKTVAYHLTTNGLRLGPEELGFLVRHDFRVDLSMDGVAPAQDARGFESFAALDALLRRWRGDHPHHFRRRCRVAVTVTRPGIRHLADSVLYLLDGRIPSIVFQPAMGGDAWTAEDVVRLDAQLARIESSAVEHHRRTGAVPLGVFRKDARRRRGFGARTWGCSAPSGRALALDVDGQVYPCVLAARSYQRFEDPGVDRRLACLALGDIRDGGLARLRSAPEAAAASGIFAPKRLQHAGERRCATCRYRGGCFVCPIGRTWQAPAGDLNAVPHSLCAFNRLLEKHARRFRAGARPGGDGVGRLLSWLFSRPPSAS
ncbi:MAG TPA: radical SAM protein [Vicinamibacterales bacterium]|nr:radical SAM protein [Vicinamibacterales bacterium]